MKLAHNFAGRSKYSAVPTVFVASGESLVDSISVSGLAGSRTAPVLMTAADELPSSTADYIRDNDVENVQIIGGTDTVSAAVADSLSTLGVDTVQRVDGESAAAVSVELANTAAACQGVGGASLTVAADRVVLVRGNPDGVAAAPVLASGIDGDTATGLVPPLVVGDSLPAVVRDYLAATPSIAGGSKLDLGIVAVGGTAAVSQSVMDAAVSAAAATGALTVQTGATTDTTGDGVPSATDPVRPQDANGAFTLYFSDAVTFDDETGDDNSKNPKLKGKLRDIIEVNGVPAVIDSATQGGANCDSTKADVTLGRPLSDGDTISVAQSSHKLGTSLDQRTVAPVSSTVQAPPVDRGRPSVSIVGIAGTGAFYVTVTDPGGLEDREADSLGAGDFVFTANPRATAGAEIASTGAVTNDAVAQPTGGGPLVTRMTAVVWVSRSAVPNVVDSNELMAGDRLTIKSDVIKDLRKPRPNVNGETSGTVIAAQASPRITSVLLSNPNHSAQNAWIVPNALVTGTGTTPGAGNELTIEAEKSGDAAGAAGNSWTFVFDRASTYDPAKPLDIDVRVDTTGKRVIARFNNGPLTATLGDLLDALKANPEFDQRFSAGFTVCANAAAGRRAQLALATPSPTTPRSQPVTGTGAGRTKVAAEVHFNAYVDTVDHTGLLTDVLDHALSRSTHEAIAGLRAAAGANDGGLGLASPTAITTIVGALATGTAPTQVVRYEAETALVDNLPQVGDRVVTQAGHQGADSAVTGPPKYSKITPVTAVATGYASDIDKTADADENDLITRADNARDRVDENRNAASIVPVSAGGSRVRPPR